MFLTKADVMNFPTEAYASVFAIKNAIYDRFSCGISSETAARIITDYHTTH